MSSRGSIRAGWQDRYGFALQSTGISTALTFDTSAAESSKGLGAADIFGIPITANPNIEANPQFLGAERVIGLATRRVRTDSNPGFDGTKTIDRPSVTIEVAEVEVYTLNPFLWLLFQKGAAQAGASGYVKTFTPYTDAGAEAYASVCRSMSPDTSPTGSSLDDWQAIHGCVATSITLSAEENGALGMTAELLAADYDASFNPAASADTRLDNFPNKAPLLWSNATVTLAGTAMNTSSFSLTLTNNAVQKFYNSGTAQRVILGRLTGTGSFMMPWDEATVGGNAQLLNFLNGDPQQLIVYWGDGTVDADGELKISVYCKYTGAPIEVGDEISTALEFEVVSTTGDSATTEDAIEIQSQDSYDLGIT